MTIENKEIFDSTYVPDDAFDLIMGNPSDKLKYVENIFDGEKWIPKKD